MRELFVQTCTVTGEDGHCHQFDYFVVIGEMEVRGGFSCESYGVKITEQGGDSVVIPNITVDIARIDHLVELLTGNTVGPVSARDVISDWL